MKLQRVTDKIAIGISCICVLHCLALPLLLILLPSIAFLAVDENLVHRLLLLVIIPISLVAVITGYQQHGKRKALYFAIAGLLLLIFSAVIGHDFGHLVEVSLTVIGSILLVIGHLKNAWDSRQSSRATRAASV